MQRLRVLWLTLFLVAALAVPATVSAQALVFHDQLGCGVIGSDFSFIFTLDTQVVVSDSGNVKATCRAQQMSNLPAKAVRWNFANTGLTYFTPWGPTQDWQIVITPSGEVTLNLHINPNPK